MPMMASMRVELLLLCFGHYTLLPSCVLCEHPLCGRGTCEWSFTVAWWLGLCLLLSDVILNLIEQPPVFPVS